MSKVKRLIVTGWTGNCFDVAAERIRHDSSLLAEMLARLEKLMAD